MDADKFIDIEKLIASKNPGALKWAPRFVLRYLKRIIHQDEVNNFIEANKDKEGTEWCESVREFMNITVSIINKENIPIKGRVVLVMNHPLGGMDAIMLIAALKGHREDLKFIVNDLLMNLESMRNTFVGIDKIGRHNSSIRHKLIDLFSSENAVSIFPAGLVSRKINKEIKDLVWKKTFVTFSKEYDRTIIPIFIEGKLSNFFYRLARLRKFLGIKLNIEMLYLSNELFKQRNSQMRFVVGTPINCDSIKKFNNDLETAQKIKEIVYELRNQL
jgi:putative hemolysin